jgi:hypothetical protein
MRSGRRRQNNDEFPEGFTVQPIGVAVAKAIANLPPAEISRYFREHPGAAKDLLNESNDKRCTPASFIAEDSEGFRVGWFSSSFEYECVRNFSSLADAATDYLLLSLGKGRWTPSEPGDSN